MEVLVATFVLTVGVLSAFLFFTNAMNAAKYARDITTATSQAEYILEEMETRNSLVNITATDWTAWAQAESLNGLPSEVISVVYANAVSDPLEINAVVSWVRDERTNNITLTTQMTK